METRTIFFIGKPGCGKGTQAKLLSEKTSWPILSAGKQFRAIGAEDTPVGRKIKSEIDAGMLAPHWFAMYLYQKSLFSIPEGASAIFDGFNRKLPEAELIVASLNWLNRPFTVFNIAVSDESVRERLLKRKDVEGRIDDHSVETRLEEYELYTEKALTYFRDAGVLIEVDGEKPPEEVAASIAKVLNLP